MSNDPDIQYFAESGTWIRPPGAVRAEVLVVAAGSGGSFGKDGSNGEVRRWSMPASGEELPETVEVTIGKGGRGVDGGGDGADGCAVITTHLRQDGR